MDFDQALAISGPHAATVARRRLQRALDAADETHRERVSERLAVSRYAAELDADVSELQGLAEIIVRAGRQAALRLNRLGENNLSVPDSPGPLACRDLAERLEEALDGLLTPSAARLLGAAVALELC
jgi:hypothetical protein